MSSASYLNDEGVLTPDNWLVSPRLPLNGILKLWMKGQDTNDFQEHVAIYVSTTGNTVADFTDIVLPETVVTNEYTEYTANLSQYAGEQGYIAIRHFNCTDMFILDVDDLQLTNGAKNRANIVNFKVYRSTDNANYDLVGTVAYVAGQTYYEYIDTPAGAGTYYYQVTTVYDNECESEPAAAFDNPNNDYVEVGVTGINENNDKVALYPNPTKGNVTIEANGMSRITVVSMLGQVVFDTELDANVYTLNMAQFNAGMYMVRVYTEDGMTVKRATVMR
jgi:hypothetical protein